MQVFFWPKENQLSVLKQTPEQNLLLEQYLWNHLTESHYNCLGFFFSKTLLNEQISNTTFNLQHGALYIQVNRQLVTGRILTRSFSAVRWGYDRWWGIDSMCTLSFISLSRICTSCCMEGRWPDSNLDHTGTSTTKHMEKTQLNWQRNT